MKKLLAVLLAAMLALLCGVAIADEPVKLNENSDTLAFYINVPNGMAMEQYAYDAGVFGTIEIAGLDSLSILFSLMPDDSYADMDMSELTGADVTNLSGTVIEDLGESTSELYDMPCGLKAMVIRDVANTEYITMTLKDGYFFYMTGFHDNYSPLSAEEVAAVKNAFDSLSYESTKK